MAAQTQSKAIAAIPKTDTEFSVPIDLSQAQAQQVSRKGYAPLETDTNEFYWIVSDDFLGEWLNGQEEARSLLEYSKLCIEEQLAKFLSPEEYEGFDIIYSRAIRLLKPKIDLDQHSTPYLEL